MLALVKEDEGALYPHGTRNLKDRIDRAAGVVSDRFFLSNGGFKAETMSFGDSVRRPASGVAPDVVLPEGAGETAK
jgi:hypothetical protein